MVGSGLAFVQRGSKVVGIVIVDSLDYLQVVVPRRMLE